MAGLVPVAAVAADLVADMRERNSEMRDRLEVMTLRLDEVMRRAMVILAEIARGSASGAEA